MPGLLAAVSVFDFGATGVGDDTLAFQGAANSGFRNIIVPPGNYTVSGQVNVAANQVWFMAGVTITTPGTTVITFNCVGIDDWGDCRSSNDCWFRECLWDRCGHLRGREQQIPSGQHHNEEHQWVGVQARPRYSEWFCAWRPGAVQ